MADNYTLQDLLGILRVAPVFALVLLVPGYLAGMLSSVFSFRDRGVSERILLSLALSCAISPYLVNILCRFVSVRTVSILFLVLGLAFLIVVFFQWKGNGYKVQIRMHWTTKAALGMVAVWVVICLASLPDMQFGQRIYANAASYDYAVRVDFISSALRTGSPPANPFFFPGSAVPARYYYYWNVLCAIPAYISGANARVVLYASCIWSGFCLASIIPVYLKHFLGRDSRLRLTTLIGFGLIAITGLDIIPILVICLFRIVPFADMEWWDPTQVASWFDSLLWVPHHVASLVACLVGFLLLSKLVARPSLSSKVWLLLLSSVGFASAAGLSVYVTFTFALFIVAWISYLVIRRQLRSAALHVAVGVLAVIMSIGYLADLHGHGVQQATGATSFVAFSLRVLPPLFAVVPDALDHFSGLASTAFRLLLILPTLLLELGIYFAVAEAQLKLDWKQRHTISEAQKSLWIMVASALVVMIFLRSTVIGSNDLAWRGALVLQFVLLLWTAIYLADRFTSKQTELSRPWIGRFSISTSLAILILIGGASSIYQLFMLRSYTFLSDTYRWPKNILMATGQETFLLRQAYAEMNPVTKLNAVVQYNPRTNLAIQNMIYSRNQFADSSSPDCGTAFGGSLDRCRELDAQLNRIFDSQPVDNVRFAEVVPLCRSLKIDQLVVNAHDPIWKQTNSWVWRTKPLIQNEFVRIYRCEVDLSAEQAQNSRKISTTPPK